MPKTRRPLHIAILAFDGIQVLDVTGPAAVFGAANDAAGTEFYRVRILSAKGGTVRSNCAVALATESIADVRPEDVDTFLVPGGERESLRRFAAVREAGDWLRRASTRARRIGSVCSGVFILAHLGIVRGKRVATHWEATNELAVRFPEVEVDANALYVEDGRVWTSAGVTTGIDMSLAMVERDVGAAVANAIARRLVLYARRPGYQSQFSPMLHAQARADGSFAALIDWMKEHLTENLDVPALAARAAMSDRSFHRRFTEAVGETPARFVETLRLDHARTLLASRLAIKEIAARTGYATAAQFSKAFDRRFGMSPLLFREIHCSAAAGDA